MPSFDKMWETTSICTPCGCDQQTKNPRLLQGQVSSKLFPERFPARFVFLVGAERALRAPSCEASLPLPSPDGRSRGPGPARGVYSTKAPWLHFQACR